MKITENGVAAAGIILPPEPTPREIFAAQELVKYVSLMSGAELSYGEACENSVIIGSPRRNPTAGVLISEEEFSAKIDGAEGFIILADEKHLLLAGGDFNDDERGTVYAVYELLERYFGCGLSAYSNKTMDAGEYVPQKATLEILGGYVKPHADLTYRTAIAQYDVWVGDPDHELNDRFISWLAKNRYNRILTWSGVYEGFKKNGMLGEACKRGIKFSVGHHQCFSLFLPPHGNEYFTEKYFETHPEYFRLNEDGTRYEFKEGEYMGQLTLCMRNKDMIKTFASNVIAWSEKNPQADVICLWPQDGCHPQCCCSECSKHTKTANYSYFVGEVAKIVNKKLPSLKFDRIAYVDLLDCDEADFSKNVIIDEAVWFSSGLRTVGKPDGSAFADTEYEKTLLAWKNTGATVVYYDYYMGVYACKQKWMPAADEIRANAKRMKEKGISGAGSQLELFNMWNHIFNFYTFARTMYDNSISMEDALDGFSRIFGHGAPAIKEVIRMGEAVLDGQVSIKDAASYVMNDIDREKVYTLYEQALAAAETPRVRNNVRLMRMAFRYSDLEAHTEHYGDAKSGKVLYKDDTGELRYMREHFDSFITHNEGCGIAIPVDCEKNVSFAPDKWYMFE